MNSIARILDETLEKALNREFISKFAKTATVIGELDEHPINIALQGITGSGKTAITKQWARDHADEINFVEFSSCLLRINEIDGKKIIFTDDALELMKKPHTVLFFDDYHLLNKEVETELNRLLDYREVETLNGTVKLDNILFVVVAITV